MYPITRQVRVAGLTFRPAETEDLPFLAAVYASTRREEMALSGWPETVQAAFLQQQHLAQHAHYRAEFPNADWLVVEEEAVPIGRLYIDRGAGCIRLIDIALLPETRGRGWGTAILQDLLSIAKQSARPVLLHVDKRNAARWLYERLGFVVTADRGTHFEMQSGKQAS